MNEKEIVLEIQGKEYKVMIEEFTADSASVRVNGNKYSVSIKDLGIEQAAGIKPEAGPARKQPPRVEVGQKKKTQMQKPKAIPKDNAILSPLPGQLLKLFVQEGDFIEVGQRVCVLEAMKMENEVNSTVSGVIIDIKYNEGDTINQGDILFLVKPPEN
ncbi:hypothetical protein J7K93_06320 [bacterium]|nr:hypothetical protein [bacterium]